MDFIIQLIADTINLITTTGETIFYFIFPPKIPISTVMQNAICDLMNAIDSIKNATETIVDSSKTIVDAITTIDDITETIADPSNVIVDATETIKYINNAIGDMTQNIVNATVNNDLTTTNNNLTIATQTVEQATDIIIDSMANIESIVQKIIINTTDDMDLDNDIDYLVEFNNYIKLDIDDIIDAADTIINYNNVKDIEHATKIFNRCNKDMIYSVSKIVDITEDIIAVINEMDNVTIIDNIINIMLNINHAVSDYIPTFFFNKPSNSSINIVNEIIENTNNNDANNLVLNNVNENVGNAIVVYNSNNLVLNNVNENVVNASSDNFLLKTTNVLEETIIHDSILVNVNTNMPSTYYNTDATIIDIKNKMLTNDV